MTTVLFSHGKESGPSGTKINRLRQLTDAHGFPSLSIDYTETDDPDKRVDILSAVIEQIDGDFILVGSSMGGYVSLVNADIYSPKAVFLMAPALYMPGYKVQQFKKLNCPISIMHGRYDEVIPMDNTLDYILSHDESEIIMYESDHRLIDVLEEIAEQFYYFLRSLRS